MRKSGGRTTGQRSAYGQHTGVHLGADSVDATLREFNDEQRRSYKEVPPSEGEKYLCARLGISHAEWPKKDSRPPSSIDDAYKRRNPHSSRHEEQYQPETGAQRRPFERGGNPDESHERTNHQDGAPKKILEKSVLVVRVNGSHVTGSLLQPPEQPRLYGMCQTGPAHTPNPNP